MSEHLAKTSDHGMLHPDEEMGLETDYRCNTGRCPGLVFMMLSVGVSGF